MNRSFSGRWSRWYSGGFFLARCDLRAGRSGEFNRIVRAENRMVCRVTGEFAADRVDNACQMLINLDARGIDPLRRLDIITCSPQGGIGRQAKLIFGNLAETS